MFSFDLLRWFWSHHRLTQRPPPSSLAHNQPAPHTAARVFTQRAYRFTPLSHRAAAVVVVKGPLINGREKNEVLKEFYIPEFLTSLTSLLLGPHIPDISTYLLLPGFCCIYIPQQIFTFLSSSLKKLLLVFEI